MSQLPDNLKNFRILRGYSQRKVADLLHKSPNTVSNWEKGTNSPDVDILEDICKLYKVTPNELYGWDKSDELESFLAEQKDNINIMDNLIKQRSDLDARIKQYADLINRRLK